MSLQYVIHERSALSWDPVYIGKKDRFSLIILTKSSPPNINYVFCLTENFKINIICFLCHKNIHIEVDQIWMLWPAWSMALYKCSLQYLSACFYTSQKHRHSSLWIANTYALAVYPTDPNIDWYKLKKRKRFRNMYKLSYLIEHIGCFLLSWQVWN